VTLSEIPPLLMECKSDLKKRACRKCPETSCPASCRVAQKIEALHKAARIVELLKTLEIPERKCANG